MLIKATSQQVSIKDTFLINLIKCDSRLGKQKAVHEHKQFVTFMVPQIKRRLLCTETGLKLKMFT